MQKNVSIRNRPQDEIGSVRIIDDIAVKLAILEHLASELHSHFT